MTFWIWAAAGATGYTTLMVIAIKAGWVDRAIDWAQARRRKPVRWLTDDEVKFLQIVMSYKHETASHPTEGLTR